MRNAPVIHTRLASVADKNLYPLTSEIVDHKKVFDF